MQRRGRRATRPVGGRVVRGLLLALAVSGLFAQEPAPAGGETSDAKPPSTEGEAPEKATPAESAEDRALRENLEAIFGRVERLRSVEVGVGAAVVTLTGSLASPTARDDAAKIAGDLPGVVHVENLIEVQRAEEKPPVEEAPASPTSADELLQERIQSVFSNVESLREIQVDVSGGVVKLGGEVALAEDQAKAAELAGKFSEVLFVDNNVEVTADLTERLSPSVERLVQWGTAFIRKLPLIGVALAIVLAFWFLGALLSKANFIFRFLTDRALIQHVIGQVVRTAVVLFGIYLALEILEATALVGAVLGTAGILGLAVGFAFRDIAENYLASIILGIRQPFRAKDLVEIAGQRGTVIRLTMSDTVLMTSAGNHLRMPNSSVFKSTIVNYSQNPLRKFDFAVGVGVEEDVAEAQQIGLQVLTDLPGVLDDPAPFARVEALGDCTVNLRFHGWVDQTVANFGKVQSEAIRLLKTKFDDEHIDMPMPSYQILVDGGTKALVQDSADTAPDLTAEEPERAPSYDEAARQVDVSVDRTIEEQVEKDLEESAEEDLLTEDDEEKDVASTATEGKPEPASTEGDQVA